MNVINGLNEVEDGVANVEMENQKHFYTIKDPYNLREFKLRNLYIEEWITYKETPKGYWVVPDYEFHGNYVNTSHKKWIAKEQYYITRRRKKALYSTLEEALYSYYRRKLIHLIHLEEKHSQLKNIVRHIEETCDIFGEIRPKQIDIRWLRDYNDHILTPLERERMGFLKEDDFEL